MPFLLIIGFYIKSYKNRKIMKQWELEEELEEKLKNIDIILINKTNHFFYKIIIHYNYIIFI